MSKEIRIVILSYMLLAYWIRNISVKKEWLKKKKDFKDCFIRLSHPDSANKSKL